MFITLPIAGKRNENGHIVLFEHGGVYEVTAGGDSRPENPGFPALSWTRSATGCCCRWITAPSISTRQPTPRAKTASPSSISGAVSDRDSASRQILCSRRSPLCQSPQCVVEHIDQVEHTQIGGMAADVIFGCFFMVREVLLAVRVCASESVIFFFLIFFRSSFRMNRSTGARRRKPGIPGADRTAQGTGPQHLYPVLCLRTESQRDRGLHGNEGKHRGHPPETRTRGAAGRTECRSCERRTTMNTYREEKLPQVGSGHS